MYARRDSTSSILRSVDNKGSKGTDFQFFRGLLGAYIGEGGSSLGDMNTIDQHRPEAKRYLRISWIRMESRVTVILIAGTFTFRVESLFINSGFTVVNVLPFRIAYFSNRSYSIIACDQVHRKS